MHEMEYIRECHDKGMILWLRQRIGQR
jgi:hypothetical protein